MASSGARTISQRTTNLNSAAVAEPVSSDEKLPLDIPNELRYREAMKAAMAIARPVDEARFPFPVLDLATHLEGRQRVRGIVESAKMDKTIVVRKDKQKEHSRYKKRVTKSTKFYAHDEFNIAKIGDTVQIIESRPLSKMKRFVLEAIIEERPLARPKKAAPEWVQYPPLVLVSIPGMTEVGETQQLVKDRHYSLNVELAYGQLMLFSDEDLQSRDDSDETNHLTFSAHRSSVKQSERLGELEVRFASDELKIEPSFGVIRSIRGRPKLELSSFSLIPVARGMAELRLSVVSGSSGEVIQSQAFEFHILERQEPSDAG